MSYPAGSGPPGFHSAGGDVGYSSQSDIETATVSAADYSDHEAGYSSAASNSFDTFLPPGGYPPSSRVPPAYAQRYVHSSQSPPNLPAQPQFYGAAQQQPHSPLPASALQHGEAGGAPGQQSQGAQAQQGQNQPQQQQYQRIARFVGPPPVALACTECRGRHLKCDAGVPACSRCIADKRECCYVKSRRGWKGTRRKKAAAAGAGGGTGSAASAAGQTTAESQQSGTDTEGPEVASGNAAPRPPRPLTTPAPSTSTTRLRTGPSSAPPVPVANFSPSTPGPHTNPLETLRAHHKNSSAFPSQQEPQASPPATANLMQLYYTYFHSAHPFCLPPAYLIKTSAPQLTALLPVMRYIASFYARTAPTETFAREAENALFGAAHPPPNDAFTVQALLLFAIGLHSDNDQERAAQVLDLACDMALDLGMNHKEFAEGTGGAGDAGRVVEESWRRTWWELYFLDGLMAGIHQREGFRLWSVECTVPLPCEENMYMLGRIPEPHSLQEFDERYFADGNTVFSSFAYRVEAIRILGQVLVVQTASQQQQQQQAQAGAAAGQGTGGGSPIVEDPRTDAADASIVNWGLHLPEKKKELVNNDRRVDEMLFQAHMVINAATIYLHRPRSHLAITLPLVPDDAPGPVSAPTKPIALHTAKTISAANSISKLLTLPTPLIKHSPFLTSVITLASTVHLSACSWLLTGDEGFLAKERIRLGVGALKTLGEVWSVSGEVLGHVRFVAREVFRMPPPEGMVGAATMAGVSMWEEEVLRFLGEERGWDGTGGDGADWGALPGLEWDGS